MMSNAPHLCKYSEQPVRGSHGRTGEKFSSKTGTVISSDVTIKSA